MAEQNSPPTPNGILETAKTVFPFNDLLRLGGFPEPLLDNDETAARRWRRERVDRILRILDIVSPGASVLFAGVERTDAPMSYSGSLRPGEAADLRINEGGIHWITIGEASGGDLQGYLEGAFRSADAATAHLIQQLRPRKHPN